MLEAHGDRLDVPHAINIEARRLLLVGSLEEAERVLGAVRAACSGLEPRAEHNIGTARSVREQCRLQGCQRFRADIEERISMLF
jgi:hypothetical protein